MQCLFVSTSLRVSKPLTLDASLATHITKREGPFLITEVLSLLTYKLQIPKVWNIHPVFHASLLLPYHKNDIYSPNFPRPPPDLIIGEEEFEVQQILHHRGSIRQCFFLIQWKGYMAEEDSWIPEKDLSHAKDILKDYKKSNPSVFSLSPKTSPSQTK